MIQCSIDESIRTAVVTIKNRRRLNAMTLAMWRQLGDVFIDLGARDTLRCIILQGESERAFSAGADISEFATVRGSRAQVESFHEEYVGPCLAAILGCPVPVVAAIRGTCVGGGFEIAAACDIRIADETTRLGAPVGRLGFPLALGETSLVFDLAGPSVCAELLIEGRVFDADEALRRGLVTRVVPANRLDAEVQATVDSICASGIAAARSHKAQLHRLRQRHLPIDRAERLAVYAFADTTEYQEGFRAFLRS